MTHLSEKAKESNNYVSALIEGSETQAISGIFTALITGKQLLDLPSQLKVVVNGILFGFFLMDKWRATTIFVCHTVCQLSVNNSSRKR